MKKSVLFFLGLATIGLTYGQEKSNNLQKKLEINAKENQIKLSNFIEKNKSQFNKTEIEEMKSKLATFKNELPIFWQEEDNRANKSANITELQNGQLFGLNNSTINGSGINIIVMDGGRVFE